MGALEEIEAIKQLKARYFRLHGHQAVGRMGRGVHRGRDSGRLAATRRRASRPRRHRAAASSAVLRDATTVHHGHMPEIELTGPDTATGIWAMYDFVELPQLVLHGWGHYHEEYVKQDGAWRIRDSGSGSSRLRRRRHATT